MGAEILDFLRIWSPHVWMFGSVFGVIMSGVLLKRAYDQQVMQIQVDGETSPATAFWLRHSLWFFMLHSGYLIVGFIAVLHLTSVWANLLTLFLIVSTPLVLVYRSYDSLRLQAKLRTRAHP